MLTLDILLLLILSACNLLSITGESVSPMLSAVRLNTKRRRLDLVPGDNYRRGTYLSVGAGRTHLPWEEPVTGTQSDLMKKCSISITRNPI